MGLFDALSGRIGHFNSVAVPTHNSIGNKIRNLQDGIEKVFFALSLDLIAQGGVDLFFRPGAGPAIKDIKEYNQHDFEKLYAVFIIWAFYDFCSFFNASQKDILKNKLQSILDLSEDEFSYYYKELEHKMEIPLGLEKLWKEITKIIHTMPPTEENYLVFSREFSKICKETYQKLQ
jgi:hypothetical protein